MASVAKSENWNSKNRPAAGKRRADRDARRAQFGDRRIHHAVFAEAMHEIAGHLKGAAIDADILAHEEDPLIGFHGLRQRLLDGLRIGQFADGRVHAGIPGV